MSAMIVPVGARRTRDEVPATVKRAFLPLITMFAISTGVAAALDTTGHGGIIEGVTANGASGFVTARVSNPFDVPSRAR